MDGGAVTSRATDIRVDWRRILCDLRHYHGSMQAVATAAAIPRTTLLGLSSTWAEPRYFDSLAVGTQTAWKLLSASRGSTFVAIARVETMAASQAGRSANTAVVAAGK
jgi:hypothetical protein